MAKITLAYWDIRGLGEPIRFLLHYKKVKFEDKRYRDRDSWFEKDKFQLGLDFPNLPYYIEGDLKITQSFAILRYLGEKYDLVGQSKEDRIRLNMAEQYLNEILWKSIDLFYGEDFDTKKGEFIANAPSMFQLLENFIGNRMFIVSDDITYVDFFAYHVLDYYRMLIASIFDGFPKLKAYHRRIISLPELKEYLKSDYLVWPIFSTDAKFGGANHPAPSHA